jgi:hypothetical protein
MEGACLQELPQGRGGALVDVELQPVGGLLVLGGRGGETGETKPSHYDKLNGNAVVFLRPREDIRSWVIIGFPSRVRTGKAIEDVCTPRPEQGRPL